MGLKVNSWKHFLPPRDPPCPPSSGDLWEPLPDSSPSGCWGWVLSLRPTGLARYASTVCPAPARLLWAASLNFHGHLAKGVSCLHFTDSKEAGRQTRSRTCPGFTELEWQSSNLNPMPSEFALFPPDHPIVSEPKSVTRHDSPHHGPDGGIPGHPVTGAAPFACTDFWCSARPCPRGNARRAERVGTDLVWDRVWLIFPLNNYILLIGLLRQYNIPLDFQRDANKLCEELNHVSIPKACKR